MKRARVEMSAKNFTQLLAMADVYVNGVSLGSGRRRKKVYPADVRLALEIKCGAADDVEYVEFTVSSMNPAVTGWTSGRLTFPADDVAFDLGAGEEAKPR